MQSRELSFNNDIFRILQITDIQEPPSINSNTMRLINAALDYARPDFAVLTGDQIKGYSTSFFSGNIKEKTEKLIKDICAPMAERNIPFTATFGNHDEQCGIGKELQAEMYKSCPGFVYGEPAVFGDYGTFVLSVEDKYLIWIFDTHEKDGHGGFGCLHPDQIEWYRKTRDEYEKKCGRLLPGIAFQHIPTPEFFEVLHKVSPLIPGSIRAYGPHKNTWYKLDPHNSGLRDFLGEAPAPSHINSGEIDAFLEKGDVKALFAGHNHNNSYVADYKGIALGFTQGCGFNVYGPGLNRGVRYIDIYPDGHFETRTLTYRELCGTEYDNKLIYLKQAMAPVSVAGVKTAFKELGITAGAVGAVTAAVKIIKKYKR